MDKEVELLLNAEVIETTDEKEIDDVIQIVKASSTEEAASVVVDGKPRMLLMNAWMVHEGRNENGQAFVAEELKQRVQEGLFAPPHMGMIDVDHNFSPIGAWYSTSYAFDDKANKWGVLAKGAIWAWRFGQEADMILAEMHRNGTIPVSMAATSEGDSYEITMHHPEAEGKHTLIVHNPVFLTTSILTVPPGDKFARAVGSEVGDPELASGDLAVASKTKETQMNEQEIKALQDQLAAVTAAKEAAEASAREVSDKLAVEKANGEKLTSDLAAATTKISELELALKTATEKVQSTETELASVSAELEGFKQKEKEASETARLDTRLSELPEAVRSNLDSFADKDALLATWKSASDEEWDRTKQLFALSSKNSYEERSKLQARIASGTTKSSDSEVDLNKHLR